MADLATLLARLDVAGDDAETWSELAAAAPRLVTDGRAQGLLAEARARARAAGAFEVAARLLDLELDAAGTGEDRRADLLLEKATLQLEDLLDPDGAIASLDAALSLRPGDAAAQDQLQLLAEQAENWEKFAGKYLAEARGSTDRQLATTMYLSAAELFARHRPDGEEVEQHLRAALEADPRNRKASIQLDRYLARRGRLAERATLIETRAEHAASDDEQAAAYVALAQLRMAPPPAGLGDADGAMEALRSAVAAAPAHPVAVRLLAAEFERRRDWAGRVAVYQGALRGRRGGEDDAGILLQLGTILWRDLGDEEQAEEYFRRLRKVAPAHPVMLDFYRAYYTERGDSAKLMSLLRGAERSAQTVPPPVAAAGNGGAPVDAKAAGLALEIARLAEAQPGNPEKAIDAWKQVVRADAGSAEARAALHRLYRKTEKWNALLDLLKDDVERMPEADADATARQARVARLFEMVEIYRDRLRLDGMVISTYGAILRAEPDNQRAIDELAERFRTLQRWGDLITTLTRKAELAALPPSERVGLWREVADLWIDRFSNYAQAVAPLEHVLALAPAGTPAHDDAVARLKDIYARRRQWRPLIELLGTEAAASTVRRAGPSRPRWQSWRSSGSAIRGWRSRSGTGCWAMPTPTPTSARRWPGWRRSTIRKRWPALLRSCGDSACQRPARRRRWRCSSAGLVLLDHRRAGGGGAGGRGVEDVLTLEPSHARAADAARDARGERATITPASTASTPARSARRTGRHLPSRSPIARTIAARGWRCSSAPRR
ncbi:MAG: hypothetical protein R2939_14120 [Kofleriaceae bacterium]